MNFLRSYIEPFTNYCTLEDEDVSKTPKENETEEEKLTEPVSDEKGGWISGLYQQSGNVWQDIKRDFVEVATVAKTEPKQAFTRTTASVRQQLSSVASAASQFASTALSVESEAETVDEKTIDNDGNPDSQDTGVSNEAETHDDNLSSLSTEQLRASLGGLVSAFGRGISTLASSSIFLGGLEESESEQDEFFAISGGSSAGSAFEISPDKRRARLQVLRADPATYETAPPEPLAGTGLLSYADWRAGYFDEDTCQPRPGIPLPLATANAEATGGALAAFVDIEPEHPCPADLLKECPVIRQYLTRLVDQDVDTGERQATGLTDGDFWSRYYYRVWLLDVAESRRRRLAERVAIARQTGGGAEAAGQQKQQLTMMGAGLVAGDAGDSGKVGSNADANNSLAKQLLAKAAANAAAALNRTDNDWDDEDDEEGGGCDGGDDEVSVEFEAAKDSQDSLNAVAGAEITLEDYFHQSPAQLTLSRVAALDLTDGKGSVAAAAVETADNDPGASARQTDDSRVVTPTGEASHAQGAYDATAQSTSQQAQHDRSFTQQSSDAVVIDDAKHTSSTLVVVKRLGEAIDDVAMTTMTTTTTATDSESASMRADDEVNEEEAEEEEAVVVAAAGKEQNSEGGEKEEGQGFEKTAVSVSTGKKIVGVGVNANSAVTVAPVLATDSDQPETSADSTPEDDWIDWS